MARTYIISEICGDWALQIREPGHPHQFLYFNSENNADLVKSILEWEDEHPNEAVPYKPTFTPPNEPLTLDELREMDGEPVYVHNLFPAKRKFEWQWALVCKERGNAEATTYTYRFLDYGKTWIAYRRPPEGEEGDADRG